MRALAVRLVSRVVLKLVRSLNAVSTGRGLFADRRGVTAVEYAMIAFLLAIVAYGGITVYGNNLGKAWKELGTSVPG